MPIDRLDRWLGPCLMLLAVVWLWLVYTEIPGARSEAEPGPRAFPVLLGVILLGLGALITASAFARTRRADAGEALPAPTRREGVVVAGTFGLLMLYAFLLERIGFVFATPVVMVLAMRGLLRQPWVLTLVLAGGTTFACWLVFIVLLGTPLPRGSWWWLF